MSESRARRIGVLVGAVVLLAGAALRTWVALTDDGIYWPDEIFQSFEPAHRLVFGYGWLAMEFSGGLRPWVLPGFVAALLASASALGLSDPFQYIRFTKIVFVAIATASAWGSYRLARVHGAIPLYAATGAAFFALGAPAIYLAPRALSENASALLVVVGLSYALRPDASSRQRFAGNLLLGTAVIFRLHSALFCVGVVLVLLVRRRPRSLVEALAAFGLCAFALGLLDKLTWGGWFHSALAYLRFSLIEGRSVEWGTMPGTFYLRVLWTSMGPLALIAVMASAAAIRRAWPLWLITGLFLAAHSLTGHKQMRFILPALPLLASLAGIGLDQIARRRSRVAIAAAAALLASAAWSAATFRSLTMGDLGQYGPAGRNDSAYQGGAPINRLLSVAGRKSDACGVRVLNAHWAWTGGYTYLHRPVPLYDADTRVNPRYANYVIAGREHAPAGILVAVDNGLALIRTHETCMADRKYTYYK